MEAENNYDIDSTMVPDSQIDDIKEKDFAHAITFSSNDDEYLVGFENDDDPQNPLNWSRKRKWAMVTMLSSATFVRYNHYSLTLKSRYC